MPYHFLQNPKLSEKVWKPTIFVHLFVFHSWTFRPFLKKMLAVVSRRHLLRISNVHWSFCLWGFFWKHLGNPRVWNRRSSSPATFRHLEDRILICRSACWKGCEMQIHQSCFKSSPTLQPSYGTWKVRFELWIRPETSSPNLRLSQSPGILLCQCLGIFLSPLFEWALASAAFASILCCGGWTPQWHFYWLEGPSIAGCSCQLSPLATSILVSYLARKCGIFSQPEEKMKLYRRGRQ